MGRSNQPAPTTSTAAQRLADHRADRIAGGERDQIIVVDIEYAVNARCVHAVCRKPPPSIDRRVEKHLHIFQWRPGGLRRAGISWRVYRGEREGADIAATRGRTWRPLARRSPRTLSAQRLTVTGERSGRRLSGVPLRLLLPTSDDASPVAQLVEPAELSVISAIRRCSVTPVAICSTPAR